MPTFSQNLSQQPLSGFFFFKLLPGACSCVFSYKVLLYIYIFKSFVEEDKAKKVVSIIANTVHCAKCLICIMSFSPHNITRNKATEAIFYMCNLKNKISEQTKQKQTQRCREWNYGC